LFISLAILLIASQACTVSPEFNDWTSNGPESGTINALAIDPKTPTTLYAGTEGGVFKSTDGGEAWSAVNIGLPWIGESLSGFASVTALAIDSATPTTLYAGTEDGVFAMQQTINH
jgi:hypothetical protein